MNQWIETLSVSLLSVSKILRQGLGSLADLIVAYFRPDLVWSPGATVVTKPTEFLGYTLGVGGRAVCGTGWPVIITAREVRVLEGMAHFPPSPTVIRYN